MLWIYFLHHLFASQKLKMVKSLNSLNSLIEPKPLQPPPQLSGRPSRSPPYSPLFPPILQPNLRPPSSSTLPLRGAAGSSGSWGDFPGGCRVPSQQPLHQKYQIPKKPPHHLPTTYPTSPPKISNSQKTAQGIISNLQMDIDWKMSQSYGHFS